MKTISIISILCFIIVAIAGGFTIDTTHYNNIHIGACCDKQCHGDSSCHAAVKACRCIYQTTQVLLSKSNICFKLEFAGYLSPDQRLSYRYHSTDSIFHPPRA